MNKKLLISVLALLIVGLAGGGYLWWVKRPAPSAAEKAVTAIQKTTESINESATQGVLPNIGATMINPMENVPNVNPYSDTNPFSNIKTNPFQ